MACACVPVMFRAGCPLSARRRTMAKLELTMAKASCRYVIRWPVGHTKILLRQLASSAADVCDGSFRSMLKAAESREDPDVMYRLGVALSAGEGADARAGKAWLKEAAELGHARAQATLGRIVYDEMEALRQQAHAHDYQASAEAERWLKQASEQGELDATRTLIPLYIARGDLLSACRMSAAWLRRGT